MITDTSLEVAVVSKAIADFHEIHIDAKAGSIDVRVRKVLETKPGIACDQTVTRIPAVATN